MFSRLPSMAFLVLMSLLWSGLHIGQAQVTPSESSTPTAPTREDTTPVPPAPTPGGPLQPDTIAAQKAAVQGRLEALAKIEPPPADLSAQRAPLEQYLKALTTLEVAWQSRTAYMAQLEALPQRLEALEAERQALAAAPPPTWPEIDDALRDQYETQRQAALAEIETLNKQAAGGEIRLARIPEELASLTADHTRLEKELLDMRGKTPPTAEVPTTITPIALLAAQLQATEADIEAHKAEREWLTKRAPLQDALLATAQDRLKNVTRDLENIKQGLAQALRQEQGALHQTATQLQEALKHTDDPLAALILQVQLETTAIRQETARPRQELSRLDDEVLVQEKRHAQVKRNLDRLTSLVEKYGDGELVARRLLSAFETLRRARAHYNETPLQDVQARLRGPTEALFVLDDRLYAFDRQAEKRLDHLSAALADLTPAQRAARLAPVRNVLEEQKAALREQQQVLTTLVQRLTRLQTLYRDHKRLLDDSYRLVLTQMFWLRNGEPLSWQLVQTTLAGALPTMQRLYAFGRAVPERLWTSLGSVQHFWFFALAVLLVLPFVAFRIRKYLRRQIADLFTAAQQRQHAPGLKVAAITVLRAAIWPAYLVLIAWLHGQLILPQSSGQTDLALALTGSLQVIALILWINISGRALLRSNGWVQHFWGFDPVLCRILRRTLRTGCLAALILLVPRHIFLTAPGDTDTAASSLAIARSLFLLFQIVTLVLVGIVGRRNSALMSVVLTHSRQRYGLLWRLWPFIYMALLTGIVAIMTLDILGYRYAAQFVWVRSTASLVTLLLFRLVILRLVLQGLRKLITYVFSIGGRVPDPGAQDTSSDAPATRYFALVGTVCHVLLLLLSVAVGLEIWGINTLQLLTSPLGTDVMTRGIILALMVGVTIGVTQLSSALTDYLLQPKTTAQGVTREAGRKLRTLAPLVQTVIQFGAIFALVLVVLDQIGVATGPILAGVGIFGLAVGFASQSLIKDVINGMFVLFEDSLSVGDIVRLRDIGGVVERLTLRAITLRDLSGNVHVIPNSSFDMVTNMTKDYSRYVLDVGIAYREDVDVVIGILREIADTMRQEFAYRFDLLEPLEVMGLERFDDSAVVVRARLKTRPGQQWRLGREFNRRMKKIFDERGIEIPFPHRTLYWGVSQDESLAAAQAALAEHLAARHED